jgi:formylmethanofuran dehydrogenase subunit E
MIITDPVPDNLSSLFQKTVLFHGHRCPGTAYGLRAAPAGNQRVAEGPDGSENGKKDICSFVRTRR